MVEGTESERPTDRPEGATGQGVLRVVELEPGADLGLRPWLAAARADFNCEPEVVAADAVEKGGRALYFLWGSPNHGYLHVTIHRPLDSLGFVGDLGGSYVDAVSPYEFATALPCGAVGEEEEERFLDAYEAECVRRRVVCEFVRFHPFRRPSEALSDFFFARPVNDNVVVDLTKSGDRLLQELRANTRNHLRTARAAGLRYSIGTPTPNELGEFARLYGATLDRVDGREDLRFSPAYFARVAAALGDGLRLVRIATPTGETAALGLFPWSGTDLFFFLSGSDRRFWSLSPNNLMLFETALWGHAQGLKRFHLGAGAPSLAHFKRGFSRQTVTQHVGRRIYLPEIMAELCARYDRAHRPATPTSPTVDSVGFFPPYRVARGVAAAP